MKTEAETLTPADKHWIAELVGRAITDALERHREQEQQEQEKAWNGYPEVKK